MDVSRVIVEPCCPGGDPVLSLMLGCFPDVAFKYSEIRYRQHNPWEMVILSFSLKYNLESMSL
jgi:hypothetical protein